METLGGSGELMYSEDMLVNYEEKDVPIGQLFEILEQIEESCTADEIISFRENVKNMLIDPAYIIQVLQQRKQFILSKKGYITYFFSKGNKKKKNLEQFVDKLDEFQKKQEGISLSDMKDDPNSSEVSYQFNSYIFPLVEMELIRSKNTLFKMKIEQIIIIKIVKENTTSKEFSIKNITLEDDDMNYLLRCNYIANNTGMYQQFIA